MHFSEKVISETTTPDKEAVEMDRAKRGESIIKAHANSVKLLRRTGRRRLRVKGRKSRKGKEKKKGRNQKKLARASLAGTLGHQNAQTYRKLSGQDTRGSGWCKKNRKSNITRKFKKKGKKSDQQARKIGRKKKILQRKYRRENVAAEFDSEEDSGFEMTDDESISSERHATALDMLSRDADDSMSLLSESPQREHTGSAEAASTMEDLSPASLISPQKSARVSHLFEMSHRQS